MYTSEFIERLKESLEIESEEVTVETKLYELEEYDSLSILSLIVLVDENFNKKLTAEQLKSITTVGSLKELIGRENFSD